MANPTLYKKKSIEDVRTRNTTSLNTDELTRVNMVVNEFFELFKTKHLS